jgi:hypothetical protein
VTHTESTHTLPMTTSKKKKSSTSLRISRPYAPRARVVTVHCNDNRPGSSITHSVVSAAMSSRARVATVEPPSRPASRTSETSVASMLEPDVHTDGISDDDELYGPEREYAIMSPPKGNTRMTSSVLFFKVILYYLLILTCLSEHGTSRRRRSR